MGRTVNYLGNLGIGLALAAGLNAADDYWHQGTVTRNSSNPQKYTITEHLDMEMVGRHNNFGYSNDEIQQYFNYPLEYRFDETGYEKKRLGERPAVGVHPRLYFGPDDLPALRARLTNSVPGKMQMDKIRDFLAKTISGPAASRAQEWQALSSGKAEKAVDHVLTMAVVYELFRAMIDDDNAGGKKAAKALVVIAHQDKADLESVFQQIETNPISIYAGDPKREFVADVQAPSGGGKFRAWGGRAARWEYQGTMGYTQNGLLGIGYDLAYNWLDQEERALIRSTLALATKGQTFIGLETLPALAANSSNWTPMHMRILHLLLAIDGEEGFDEGTLRRCIEGSKRFLQTGLFPSGEMFEGMAKNWFLYEHCFLLARHRGIPLLTMEGARNQAANYYLNAAVPWGAGFTFYDSQGAPANNTPMSDVLVLKNMFPSDPAVDWVYRISCGEDYKKMFGGPMSTHPFMLSTPFINAVFATEYAAGSPSDACSRVTAGRPLDYFGEDTGNLLARTDWGPDATYLMFLGRTVPGGHRYRDRGHLSLYSHGRFWSVYMPSRQVEGHYRADYRSLLLCDGEGVGRVCTRQAGVSRTPAAAFSAVDTKPAWDFDLSEGKGQKIKPNLSPNDCRLMKSPLPWMNLSWGDLCNWQTSEKGNEIWRTNFPVDYAFRTAGLVRGKHPFVLVWDDIKKDGDPHTWTFQLVLDNDVVLRSTAEREALLGESKPAAGGERRLLVRCVQEDGELLPIVMEDDLHPNPPSKDTVAHKLKVRTKGISPNFKTILFPHRAGDQLPVTEWRTPGRVLVVRWEDEETIITFTERPDHRTEATIERAGQEIARL